VRHGSLGIDENVVGVDELLVVTVRDASALELLADLSGVDTGLVGSLCKVKNAAILISATLYRLATKAVDVETAVLLNPSDGLLVAAKDLVLVNLDFLAAVASYGAFATVLESLAGVDAAIVVTTSDPKIVAIGVLSADDCTLRDVLALSQDPRYRTLSTTLLVSGSTSLSILDVVLESPCLGFFVFLSVLVVLVGSIATSKESSAESEATSDLKLLAPVLGDVVPVLLLLMLMDVDILSGVLVPVLPAGVFVSAVVALLLLRLLRFLLAVVLLTMLVSAMVFVPAVVASIAVLHATPEGRRYRGCPVTLTPVRLDDFVVVTLVTDDVAVVVLCSGFPVLDHCEYK